MIHSSPHPLAGKTVTIAAGVVDPRGMITPGAEYRVEDYWDRVSGQGWGESQGNPAALNYAVRTAVSDIKGRRVSMDDEVLYGKIDSIGHLVHVSEIAPAAADTDLVEQRLDWGAATR